MALRRRGALLATEQLTFTMYKKDLSLKGSNQIDEFILGIDINKKQFLENKFHRDYKRNIS